MPITEKTFEAFLKCATKSPTFTATMLSVFLLNSANCKIICEKITSKDAESNSALLFETVSGMTESPTPNLSQPAATV